MQYQGSKAKLAKHLVPIIQSYITEETSCYIEPFVGGANMIDKIQCNNKIGYDISPTLIALLNKAKYNPDEIPDHISEGLYYEIKNNPNNYEDWLVGLAQYCASFNGLGGGYARDKVERRYSKPKVRSYVRGAIRGLKKQAPNLTDTDFKVASFDSFNPSYFSKAVIYCDPPYKGTKGYNNKSFDHYLFYEWCVKMSKRNTVLISESFMPEHFTCIWQQNIGVYHSQNTKRSRIERLYTL